MVLKQVHLLNAKKRQKVLILGANGFIGTHLTKRLLETVVTKFMQWT
ncbi:UDP-4-amino-4-deoxy-L-arabinose formyltransferase / UDP-glucuronic acid oxidase (UDP-4-keto-hexauronic acid decarboxylating) [Vibrio maritimus]|uniref:UDP-4-amino-4-deoxy-L-arabinose formyltransferase / UDP-glucuronic acid oxidase (UDP-4-keto-hexauronic acid decarboxylating) n=1 Tax=Vibrio maritimus TaxID=990268 RepID=A0A090TV50_9VIBR|nr:UDP-4-amino-4-deoxy-L-arabinose formyltransferase / UDP-glucuronic acid oxidase (UDP-4-keto-hexauronic acid decarboxylating) [Vibrio maritimus]